MKSTIKTLASVIVATAVVMGTASAMVPNTDLKRNGLPDVGFAVTGIVDLETGATVLPGLLLDSANQSTDDSIQPGTQELRDLIGKHFI